MNTSKQRNIPGTGNKNKSRCLSCGTTENIGRRKYCSIDCRQNLRYALNIRTGLLMALNIRYATFYFTDMMIIMDVLPYGSDDIFSFTYPRSNGSKPAEDYRMMSAVLGNEWWAEKNRTNKHYLASRYVLDQAIRNERKTNRTVPFETEIPVKPDAFRKIHQAYIDLVQWLENPSYIKRRGFPDKWFYDGTKNKWVQPTPYRK